jgi:hypothetical protein
MLFRLLSTWLLCALLGTTLSLGASTAHAQPTPERLSWVRSHGVVQMHAFRRRDGTVASRQSSATRVEVVTFAPRTPHSLHRVSAHVGGTWTFDMGLPPLPGSPLVAELQLEPTLDRAFVRWEIGPWIQIDTGRNDLYSAIGPARFDGVSLRVRPRRSLHIAAHVGQRNQHEQWLIDGFALAPDGDLAWRTNQPHRPWFAELSVHHETERWAVGAGARTERAWSDDVVLQNTLQAGGRLGAWDRWHALTDIRWQAIERLIDRAGLSVAGPITERLDVRGEMRLERAVFPLDSIFSVFEAPARADVGLGIARRPPSPRARLWSATLGARWWADSEITLPSLTAEQARVFVRGQLHEQRHHWSWRSAVDAEARDRGWDARISAAVQRSLPSMRRQGGRPFAQIAGTGAAGRDDRRTPDPALGALAIFSGVGLPATDWATVHVHGGWTWDLRNGHGGRALAVFDLRLPGGPP